MGAIKDIIDHILLVEGSQYTNDPNDSGGPTKYGITQRTLSKYRGRQVSPGEVASLTESEARSIYYKLYVVDPGFEPVTIFAPDIAAELVDSGVNLGPGRATEWLQRSLNALNRMGRDYADLKVDGDCGPATVKALKAFLAVRGDKGKVVLLRALNSLQGAFYIDLAERRQKDETYVFGWFLNRVVI